MSGVPQYSKGTVGQGVVTLRHPSASGAIVASCTVNIIDNDNTAYIGERNSHPYGGTWRTTPHCFTNGCSGTSLRPGGAARRRESLRWPSKSCGRTGLSPTGSIRPERRGDALGPPPRRRQADAEEQAVGSLGPGPPSGRRRLPRVRRPACNPRGRTHRGCRARRHDAQAISGNGDRAGALEGKAAAWRYRITDQARRLSRYYCV